MICPKCGHSNTDYNKFCAKCGQSLASGNTSNQHHSHTKPSKPKPIPPEPQPKKAPIHEEIPISHAEIVQPERPKKRNTGAIIIAVVAALLMIGGGIVAWYFYADSAFRGETVARADFDEDEDDYEDVDRIERRRYSSRQKRKNTEEEESAWNRVTPEEEQSVIINGMHIRWNDATPAQKSLISSAILDMVEVEGGSYYMGTDSDDAYADEKPSHRESVGSFKINRFEVTQALWSAVMGNNPSKFKGDNLPVENVSWNQCQNFIGKLNLLTGLNFRLPTEAEWEFAARGGNNSNYFLYSGDDNALNVGWVAENSGNKTHAVGQKKANELDLFDMTGNVWEWTLDRWSPDYNSPRTGETFVRRGGSAVRPSKFSRLTYRNRGDKADNEMLYGLRLAM